ncbi:hypothetical protein ACOSQ3_005270 [Xanthoceras sorbifolium]
MKALNPVRSRNSGGKRSDSYSNKENVHIDSNRKTQEEKGSNPSSVPVKESRGMGFQFGSRANVGISGVVKNKLEMVEENNSKRVVLGPIFDKGSYGSDPSSGGHIGLNFEAGGSMAAVDGGSVVCDFGGGTLVASDSGLGGSVSCEGVGSAVVVCEPEEAVVVCSLDG